MSVNKNTDPAEVGKVETMTFTPPDSRLREFAEQVLIRLGACKGKQDPTFLSVLDMANEILTGRAGDSPYDAETLEHYARQRKEEEVA